MSAPSSRLKLAKRLKGDGKTKSFGKDSGKKSNWKKKASDASDKAKSEITALVKKSVKQAVKDLKVADKKRKSSKKDDSSDEELNVIDNLAEFNYATSKLDLNDSGSDTESEVSAWRPGLDDRSLSDESTLGSNLSNDETSSVVPFELFHGTKLRWVQCKHRFW